MRAAWRVAGLLSVLVAPAHADPRFHTKPFAAEATPPVVRAGGSFELSLKRPVERAQVSVAAREVACEIAGDGHVLRCAAPPHIAPGLYLVEIDTAYLDQRVFGFAKLMIRVPEIVRATPARAEVGARVALDLDAPLPAEAAPKVFFADHWGTREARVLEVHDATIAVAVPRAPAGAPSEIWVEVGDERSKRLAGFRVIEPPRPEWLPYLPHAAGGILALALLMGIAVNFRPRRPENPAERGLNEDSRR